MSLLASWLESELVLGPRSGKLPGEGHKLGPGHEGVRRCPQRGRPMGVRLCGPGVQRGKLGQREKCR